MEIFIYIILPFAVFFIAQILLCMFAKSLRLRLIPLFAAVFMILLGLINLLGESNPLSADAAGIVGMIGSLGIACLFGCGCGWVFGAIIKAMRKV